MFRSRIGLAVLAIVALSSAADASDPKRSKPQAVSPVSAYDWTGFYVGANAGVGLLGTTASGALPAVFPDRNDITKSGLTGGLQAGFNWQATRDIVVGVEADYNVLHLSRTVCVLANCTGGANQFDVTSAANSVATLRGRLGYSFGSSMVYGTFGAAFVRSTDEWSNFANTPRVINDETRTGYAVGAGLETALFGNWSTKAEYLYINTGTSQVADPQAAGSFIEFKHEYHLTRLGLNYRFGQEQSAAAKAASAVPSYNWAGWYLGGTVGATATSTKFDVPNNTVAGVTDTVDLYGKGVNAGVQAGYNWSIAPAWVAGVEGDVGTLGVKHSYTSINTQFGGADNILSTKADLFASLRGRIGYAVGRSLVYATGGAAAVRTEDSWSNGVAATGTTTKTNIGWVAGTGLEVAVTNAWRAKAEYLYVASGKSTVTPPGGANPATFDHAYHVARVGLNYGFSP